MSSDPKGPTPLSAEADSFRAQFDRWLGNESEIVDRFIALVREQDATIDAQATEIAALKRTAAFAEAVGLSAFEIFTDYKAENAALKGALERVRDDISNGVVERPKGDRPRRYHVMWPEEEGHEGMCGYCWQPPEAHVIVELARVLAGKEAQGD